MSGAADAGVAAVDVAGAGGTNWALIEGRRDPAAGAVAAAFADWGTPTAEALRPPGGGPSCPPIASGGLRDGVDVAKCLALGAAACGLARPLLIAAQADRPDDALSSTSCAAADRDVGGRGARRHGARIGAPAVSQPAVELGTRGRGRHATGAARTRETTNAVLRASWPVLAVLALCPLAALLAPSDPAGPLARAAGIAGAESALGLRFEPAAVAWLTARPVLLDAANLFYFWVHLPATVGVLVWVWLERRAAFARARAAFVILQVAVLAGNTLLPTAPPWMSQADAARAADGAHSVYLLQSPFAAMPSGHAAWATFAAVTVFTLVRHRAVRAAAAAYLVLVVVVVLATANHFWVDAAAGAAIAAVALRVVRV